MSLLALFCDVDDFCQQWQAQQPTSLPAVSGQRRRQPRLIDSEIMTIVIHFHQSGYRNFKDYYIKYVQAHLQREFPNLVSYSRFITLMQRAMVLLWAYAQARCGNCTGISFVDSTALRVCTNRRFYRHKVFAGIAARGRCSQAVGVLGARRTRYRGIDKVHLQHLMTAAAMNLMRVLDWLAGKQRTLPLGYIRDGSSYVIIGSNGGLDRHPAWYFNLQHNPNGQIQVRDKVLQVTAETAQGEHRQRLWQQLIAEAPGYADYEKMTTREIPMVILTPTNG